MEVQNGLTGASTVSRENAAFFSCFTFCNDHSRTNDDWVASAGWGAAFTSVGAFALGTNTRDAALLVSLPPGTYTAQASGVSATVGVALIEVYDVPNPPATSFVLRPAENVPAPSATFTGTSTDLSRVDQTPTVLTQARPVYPVDLLRAGLAGETIVDFIVNVEGRVENAYIYSATDVRFGESAVAAVRQWTFRPGRRGGQDVATHMQVPVVFTLN
jgi:TonB family protein